MQKFWLIGVITAVFIISFLVSRNYVNIVNLDKIGQVVGLGAVAGGYFGARIWKKMTVEEK
jgi:uncharacterized membrane protein YfcA